MRACLLLPALLLAAPAAEAAPLRIDVRGACWLDCGYLDAAEGDTFAGRIIVESPGFTPGGELGEEALVSYAFRLGSWTYRNADAPGAFSLTWGDAPGEIAYLSVVSFASHDRNRAAPLVELYDAPFLRQAIASFDGYQWTNGDVGETLLGHAAYSTIDSVTVAPVPAPATGWLLAAGAACLAALRRGASRRA